MSGGAYERRRNLVRRGDGRLVNVARSRGQLFVCAGNCCCGRTADGFAAVPEALYHDEWERRRLRNVVHLTIGGCLGPCALANVLLLLFDGRTLWFQGMDSEALVLALYDYIEAMLDADALLPAPPPLAERQFTATTWQPRPDGQPVEDHRPRRAFTGTGPARAGAPPVEAPADADRAVANMTGPAAAPRRNGELVFAAPWEGRAFGMAVALSAEGRYAWEEFRERLIAEIGAADEGGDPSAYYERWLAAFERLLAERGIVQPGEIDERTYEFEFGERDEVF